MPSLGTTDTKKKQRTFIAPPFEERFGWWVKKIQEKEKDLIARVGYLVCNLRKKYAAALGLTDSSVIFTKDGQLFSLETGRPL